MDDISELEDQLKEVRLLPLLSLTSQVEHMAALGQDPHIVGFNGAFLAQDKSTSPPHPLLLSPPSHALDRNGILCGWLSGGHDGPDGSDPQ